MHVEAQKCLLYQVRPQFTMENKILIQGNSFSESCSSPPPSQVKIRNSRTLLSHHGGRKVLPQPETSVTPLSSAVTHRPKGLWVIWDLKDSAPHTSSYCLPVLKLLHGHSRTPRFTLQASQLGGTRAHQRHAAAAIHKPPVSVAHSCAPTCTKWYSCCTWAVRITISHMILLHS